MYVLLGQWPKAWAWGVDRGGFVRSINLRATGATTKVHDNETLSEVWTLRLMNDLSPGPCYGGHLNDLRLNPV